MTDTQPSPVGPAPAPSDLAERLGHPPGSRVVIVNGDDYGMCRSANKAIGHLMATGALDSTTIMMPCSWSAAALDAAMTNKGWDVGVHLVLTSEWENYRWRPVTGVVWGSSVSTFVDGAGFFPKDVESVEREASDSEVDFELQAQVELAIAYGLDVTHLDNHMGSVYGLTTGRSLLPVVFRLCAMHGLPFRLPRSIEGMGLPPELQTHLDTAAFGADSAGVVILDYLLTHPFELVGEGTENAETYESVKAGFIDLLRSVKPGVTEIYLHPMHDDDELRSIAHFGVPKRQWELELLQDPEVLAVFESEGLIRTGWRALRELQRQSNARTRLRHPGVIR